MSKTQTDPLDTLRAAKAAAFALGESEKAIRESHAALLKERAVVDRAFPPAEELIANLNRLVDAQAAKFASEKDSTIVRALAGHTETSVGSLKDIWFPPRLPNFSSVNDALEFSDLCGIVPDLVKTRLATIIRGAKVTFGLGTTAREAKLRELDQRIEAVEREHTRLVESANEFGIALELLPAVRVRKNNEKRAAEIAASRPEFAITHA